MNNSDMEKIKRKFAKRRLTRAKAIKFYCKEICCAGDLQSWKECSFTNCFLWNFRMGREVLGNQTSFKKHREIKGIFIKNKLLNKIPEHAHTLELQGVKNA